MALSRPFNLAGSQFELRHFAQRSKSRAKPSSYTFISIIYRPVVTHGFEPAKSSLLISGNYA